MVRMWSKLVMKVSGKCRHLLGNNLKCSGNSWNLSGNGQNMVWNVLKWSEMAWNYLKLCHGPRLSKMVQDGLKWSMMVWNGPIWSEMVQNSLKIVQRNFETVQDGLKCFRMVQNGTKWSNVVQDPKTVKDTWNIRKNTFYIQMDWAPKARRPAAKKKRSTILPFSMVQSFFCVLFFALCSNLSIRPGGQVVSDGSRCYIPIFDVLVFIKLWVTVLAAHVCLNGAITFGEVQVAPLVYWLLFKQESKTVIEIKKCGGLKYLKDG